MVEVIEKLSTILVDSDVTILVRKGHVLEDAIRSVKRPDFPFEHCLKACYCIRLI